MKPIPTAVHGILDYPVGLALIAAPYLFGFAELGGAAVLVPQILGAFIILQSAITRYEAGVFHVLPMRAHLMMDYLGGALLAGSPWLFGFANQPPRAWAPHLAVGLFILITTFLTQPHPRFEEADHRHDKHAH